MTNSLSVLDDGFADNILGAQPDPRPYYADLHRLAPVYRTPLDFWYVSSYELAKEVYSNPENWSNVPDTSAAGRSWTLGLWYQNLLSLDDPQHRRTRSYVSSLSSRKFVADLEASLRAVMDEQWALVPDGAFDFKADFAGPVGMKAVMRVVGVDLDRIDEITAMSRTLHRVLDPTVTDDELRDAEQHWRVARDVIFEMAAARRSQPAGDIITELAQKVDAGELTDDDMVSSVFLLLVAGNETSSNSMVNGLYHLLANPPSLQSITDDPTLLPSAIEELLRYEASARNSVPRYATRDLTLGDVLIRQGESMYICDHAANHDASVFENPSQLDIRRTPNRHIAFGFGVHACLGAAIARLEIKFGYESLMARYTDIELAEPVEWSDGFIEGALERLMIRGVPS